MKNYKHQQKLIDLNPKKHLLAWECGTGKSGTAIQLAKGHTLVICPKSLKENWKEEIKKFSDKHFLFLILTKEEFRRDWNTIGEADTVIVDECHYFSSNKSQMAKSLIKYTKKHKPERLYLLTATPYMSTPWNVYVLAKQLGHNWNYQEFKYKFFYDIRMGHRVIPVIKDNIEDEIAVLVNRLGSTVKINECADVPNSTFLTEYFALTSEQKKAIKEQDEVVPIAYWTKVHQICGGSLKGNDYEDGKYFKSEKLNRLIDLCDQHKKIAVVCRYNAEIEYIKKKLKGKTVLVLNGEVKDRNKVVNEANEAKECVILIQASCSEGYNLPGIPIMIFYSYDFSLKNYIQMIGRIQRINAIQKCVYISLIVKGTVDNDVFKCIQKKEDFQIAIYKK